MLQVQRYCAVSCQPACCPSALASHALLLLHLAACASPVSAPSHTRCLQVSRAAEAAQTAQQQAAAATAQAELAAAQLLKEEAAAQQAREAAKAKKQRQKQRKQVGPWLLKAL